MKVKPFARSRALEDDYTVSVKGYMQAQTPRCRGIWEGRLSQRECQMRNRGYTGDKLNALFDEAASTAYGVGGLRPISKERTS